MTTHRYPTTTPTPPGRTHPTMTTPTTSAEISADAVSWSAVRAALVGLLTTGQHHHAATPATLTAVGYTRAALADRDDDTAHCAVSCACPPEWRLTALTAALGVISDALLSATPRHPLDTAQLRTGLAELAAIALGWLDTLPDHPIPRPLHDDPDDFMPF
jgi:hypothetical protein